MGEEEGFNWQINDIDTAIDYIISYVGSDFERTLQIVNDIIEDPSKYSGPQAINAAAKLASYRTRLGVAMEYFSIKKTATKKPTDRLTNSALHVLWEGLGEVINTLKLKTRMERDILA